MKESLFRKSSIDRISSPEQLNEYIRVAQPSVWIVLGAVVALLTGAIIWGIFGTIETRVDVGVVVQGETARCYVGDDDIKNLSSGMVVTVGETQGTIINISPVPIPVPDDSYVRYYSGLAADELCHEVELGVDGLPDGIYPGSILVDSINPITFVIH